MLRTGKIVLGDPGKWDDKNDSALIEAYRKRIGIKKVFALCFAECSETYHHWKVYGDGPSGVCIEFNKELFAETLERVDGLRMGRVKYCRVDRLSDHKEDIEMWPFLKRLPFKGEEEFRLVLDYDGDIQRSTHSINFSISAIEKIYLSPWLSREVIKSIENIIRRMPECEDLIVTRTGLVDHSNWKSAFELH
jgi:hypothetical protein